MNITVREVHGFNCPDIPENGETIADHLDLDILMPHVYSVSYYLREPQDCPLARGNWMLDVQMKDGKMIAYKYPKEIKEHRFIEFLKPLLDKMKRGNIDNFGEDTY